MQLLREKHENTEWNAAGGDLLGRYEYGGYVSGKDLEKHEFDLCEECYDRITASFAVPPKVSEDMEG